MQQDIVSHIQSHWSGDGVEVRSVGPRVVTLALPPEMHDVGALCGELECEFNARIDLEASPTSGLGPIATVWLHADSADASGPLSGTDDGGGSPREASASNEDEDEDNRRRSRRRGQNEDDGDSKDGRNSSASMTEQRMVLPPWMVWAAGKVVMGVAVAAITAACAHYVGISTWVPGKSKYEL